MFVSADEPKPLPPKKKTKKSERKSKNLYNFLIPVHINCMFVTFLMVLFSLIVTTNNYK